MNFAQQQRHSGGLLGEMKAVVESLPIHKREELIAALKEIFSELAKSLEDRAVGSGE